MTSDWIEKQFDELKKLAEERFAPLSLAETKMLRAAIAGDTAWCGPSQKNEDAHNNPSSHEEWAAGREIRAELLRWFCLNKAVENHIDPRGIRLHGAKISGELDLSGAVVRFPLVLNRCRFIADARLVSADLAFLDLSGCATKAIRADRLTVRGNLFLGNDYRAEGEITLRGAQIDGSFICDGNFRNPPQKDIQGTGTALNAMDIRVNGEAILAGHFRAEGKVWLDGAEIGSNLDCSGGIFKNPSQEDIRESGLALIAQNIRVKANVFLCKQHKPFEAEGEVSFQGAQIGSSFDCNGGRFMNPQPTDTQKRHIALQMANATVNGDVHLCDDFIAQGELCLMSAQIAGSFNASKGSFFEINAQNIRIGKTLFWTEIKNVEYAKLDLVNASTGELVDDRVSWPEKGNLVLDGFIYGRVAGGPKDSASRLEWLNRQSPFTPQPYRQLAKVLRNDGDDSAARCVLFEMEKRKHGEARHGWLSQIRNLIFRETIGYGIYPLRALLWLLLLIVLGWGAYRYGYSKGAITPTNKEAYDAFHDTRRPPPNYPHFYASIYSAEHCFPLVNLGQKDAWTPDPNRLGIASFFRVFRWSQILLGWVLATFFVVGVTGIARKD